MIELRDVSLAFGDQEILRNISLTAEDGKVTAILGPSGSGKRTILKVMLGLIRAASGQVLVDGTNITKLSEEKLFAIRKKMGMVFQGNALFDSLDVHDNLGFFLRENLSLPAELMEARICEQIAFAGLEGYEQHLPEALSGGMRKRLAIGRALIFEPAMVLFDEPTVGLDPLSTRRILDVIRRLREDHGLGAVMVTHLIGDVFAVADRVIILHQGVIIFDDVPEAMHASHHPFIRSFLTDTEEILSKEMSTHDSFIN